MQLNVLLSHPSVEAMHFYGILFIMISLWPMKFNLSRMKEKYVNQATKN